MGGFLPTFVEASGGLVSPLLVRVVHKKMNQSFMCSVTACMPLRYDLDLSLLIMYLTFSLLIAGIGFSTTSIKKVLEIAQLLGRLLS